MKLIDIVDAANDCEKHQCSTIAVSQGHLSTNATCETCPSFGGIYVKSMDHTYKSSKDAEMVRGRKQVKCIYPMEMGSVGPV